MNGWRVEGAGGKGKEVSVERGESCAVWSKRVFHRFIQFSHTLLEHVA